MIFSNRVLLSLLLFVVTACTPTLLPVTPSPTLTLTPTVTSSPTAILIPTATPTPIPPLKLKPHWPQQVTSLPPSRVEVDLIPPPGVDVRAVITAVVFAPGLETYATLDLQHQGNDRYVSADPLNLPLEPQVGDWLIVFHVQSDLVVSGNRALTFRALPPPYRILTDTLPAGVVLRVPESFTQAEASGDAWAGRYVWRSCEKGGSEACSEVGEVSLFWAPGPTEPLQFSTAVMMLEATYDADAPPAVTENELIDWQGRAAFLFQELWPGYQGGPGEAWVIRSDDDWLYVLRIRAVGEDAIPDLVRQVAETFAFID